MVSGSASGADGFDCCRCCSVFVVTSDAAGAFVPLHPVRQRHLSPRNAQGNNQKQVTHRLESPYLCFFRSDLPSFSSHVSRFSSIHWHSVSPSSLFSTKPIQNTLDDTSTRVSSLMSRMAPIFSLLILTVISGDGKSRFKVHDRLAVCVNLRLSARPF